MRRFDFEMIGSEGRVKRLRLFAPNEPRPVLVGELVDHLTCQCGLAKFSMNACLMRQDGQGCVEKKNPLLGPVVEIGGREFCAKIIPYLTESIRQ